MRKALRATPSLETNANTGSFSHRGRNGAAPPDLIEKQNAHLSGKEIKEISKDLAKRAKMEFVEIKLGTGKSANAVSIHSDKWTPTHVITVGEKVGRFGEKALRGAIGHEFGHVEVNRDWGVLRMLCLLPFASGTIFAASRFAETNNLSVSTVLLGASSILASWLVGRRVTRFIESKADEFSAKLNGTGEYMIEFLEKAGAERGLETRETGQDKPLFNRVKDGVKLLFAEHPTIPARIARLEKIDAEITKAGIA